MKFAKEIKQKGSKSSPLSALFEKEIHIAKVQSGKKAHLPVPIEAECWSTKVFKISYLKVKNQEF